MDDDKTNQPENQPKKDDLKTENIYQNNPKPIFETVPQDIKSPQETLKPEEAPPTLTPEELKGPPQNGGHDTGFSDDRKKYLFIAGGVVLFLLIFGLILKLFLGRSASSKQVKLIYWGLWEDKEIVQPLINEYQQTHPNITINYQKMSPIEYREKIVARSQNKNVERPDIFRFHNTWLPEIKEVAAPLPEKIMSDRDFESTFYPVQTKDLKIGNDYYGIPLTIDGLVLVYNDNLFKRAGISSPPVSWEDITNDVAKLTVKSQDGEIITSGIALGTASNIDNFSDIFGLFLLQNGGSIDKLGQPEAAGALEVYRKFAEEPDNFWSDKLPSSVTAFTQEKVAIIIVPSWQILAIKSANPEINLKVVPVPVIPGSKPLSVASYWVEGVSRYSTNQIEAWKFLEFLSEKENMTKLYELEAKTRLFGEPYSRKDLAATLSDNQYIGPVIQQADYFQSIPTIDRTGDNGLNDNIVKYIENAINATTQGVAYDAALSTAQQGVDQVLQRYK